MSNEQARGGHGRVVSRILFFPDERSCASLAGPVVAAFSLSLRQTLSSSISTSLCP